MKICPKCGGRKFIITQHVTQTILVDGDGSFIKELSSCDEVTHAADDDDLWACSQCGYKAAGHEFNKKAKKYIILGIYDEGEVLITREPEKVFIQDMVSDFALIKSIKGEGRALDVAGLKAYSIKNVDFDLGNITKLSTWKAIMENGFADCVKDNADMNLLRFALKSKYPIDTDVFDFLLHEYPDTEIKDILWLCHRLNAAEWALNHGADKYYDGLRDPMKDVMAYDYARRVEGQAIFEFLYGCDPKEYQEILESKN